MLNLLTSEVLKLPLEKWFDKMLIAFENHLLYSLYGAMNNNNNNLLPLNKNKINVKIVQLTINECEHHSWSSMNEWMNDLFISTSRSQDWITGCGQEQLRNNKHNYYNLYYACLKYIEFWLITKYILRIFISDEIPKSKCVVWDFRLTFMSQIIWLVHPHSTVMFYNMIKWVIWLDTFNESTAIVGSSGNKCS